MGLLNFVFFIIIGGIKFGVRRMVFYAPKRLLVYRTHEQLGFSILLLPKAIHRSFQSAI